VSAFVWFYLIACAISAALTALLRVSIVFGLLGLFGPAIAAVCVTAATEGRSGVRALLRKALIWRVGLGWYIAAIVLTEAVSLLTVGLSVVLGDGAPADIKPLPIDGLKIALFVMVVGEEIGWRGFALPRLLERFRPLPASLLLGVLWAAWHLPTFFLQGTAQSHFPFPAYVLYTSSLSVLFTWFYFHTQGSVLFATFFHGCVNTFLMWNNTADPVMLNWLQAAGYAVAASLVVAFAGPPFKKR